MRRLAAVFLVALAAPVGALGETSKLPAPPPALTWEVGTPDRDHLLLIDLMVRCANAVTTDAVVVPEKNLLRTRSLLHAERALVAGGQYGFRNAWQPCTSRQLGKPLAHLVRVLRARHLGT
jgi:hypothetical protein